MKMQSNIEFWDNLLKNKVSIHEVLQKYLCQEVDLQELVKSPLITQIDNITSKLISILLTTSVQEIIDILRKAPSLKEVTTYNIPQFSNFASAVMYLPKLLLEHSSGYTFQELGYALHSDCNSDDAARKYGENHAKLAIALDLAVPSVIDGYASASPSVFAKSFCKLTQSDKEEIVAKLCFRIPIIQIAAMSEDREAAIDRGLEVLALSTRTRRKRNVRELLAYVLNE